MVMLKECHIICYQLDDDHLIQDFYTTIEAIIAVLILMIRAICISEIMIVRLAAIQLGNMLEFTYSYAFCCFKEILGVCCVPVTLFSRVVSLCSGLAFARAR